MVESHAVMVTSQKGGVGKTTVAVNLATALKQSGFNVLLIDADYSNPSVGFHLGMQEANIGFRAVVSGKASLASAVAIHHPTGVHVLPGEISSTVPEFAPTYMRNLNNELLKSRYDFIVIDTAPGPMPKEMLKPFVNANMFTSLILLTPEMAACASALRLARTYERMRVMHSMAANRIKNRGYELGIGEIEDVLGEGIIAALPEDENVPVSIAAHIPLVILKSRSPFSVAVRELTRKIITRSGMEATGRFVRTGLIGWLRRILGI